MLMVISQPEASFALRILVISSGETLKNLATISRKLILRFLSTAVDFMKVSADKNLNVTLFDIVKI